MRVLAIFVVLAVAAAAGFWYWTVHPGNAGGAHLAVETAAVDHRIPVRVATVEPSRFETVIESLGTAQANESITLTASVTATVSEIGFQDGQEVTAGQVLVRLASAEELADLREAQVALVERQRELNRIRGLAGDGIVPRQQVDQQRSRVEEAEARLAAMEARLADRVIRAPFDGVLGLRRVSTGSLVTPGTALTELDDVSVIKVDFTVPERFLGSIRSGLPIEARSVAFRDRVFEGEVTAVSSRVDVATRTVTVRATVKNPERQLRPGMLLGTRLPLDPVERPAIPEGALVSTADLHYVFVVDDAGTVRRQSIRIGRRQPGLVEVIEGLSQGERVVTEGVLRVRQGSAVRILEGAA